MVSLPKINTNLLLGVGLIGAAFLLTRQIRGAGQDLAKSITSGVLSGVGESVSASGAATQAALRAQGLAFQQGFLSFGSSLTELFGQQTAVQTQFPSASTETQDLIQSFSLGLKNLFSTQQDIIDKLNLLPVLGTPQNPSFAPVSPTGIDIILSDTTLSTAEKSELIRLFNQQQGTTGQGINQIDLSKSSPAGVFGFGLLGKDKGGISTQLAQRLGIFGKEASDISKLQTRLLQGFGSTQTVQDIIDTRSQRGVSRLLGTLSKQFKGFDFSGLTFGIKQTPTVITPIVTPPPVIPPTIIPPLTIDPDLGRSIDIRAKEIEKAQKLTCRLFGLNCPKNGGMA